MELHEINFDAGNFFGDVGPSKVRNVTIALKSQECHNYIL